MNASFASALLLSLLGYAVLTWVLLGWGSVLFRLFRIKLPDSQLIFSQIWVGWALILLLLQLIHFIVPLNWMVVTLIASGGLVALWVNRGTLPPLAYHSRLLVFAIVALLTASWIAIQAMKMLGNYDTGLYHLQTIRWLNEYAIVPGLGNLHGRFAFNQSFFTFPAALNFYPFFIHGHKLANSFLFLLLAMEGWHALILCRRGNSIDKFVAIFTLPLLAYSTFRLSPGSPTPDATATILQFILWLQFVRLLEEKNATQERSRLHIIAILAATAITVKVSNVSFIAGIGLIIFIRYWLTQRQLTQRTPLLHQIIYFFHISWLPMFILLVWIGRGYFLSGYPMYPSTIGAIPVDWIVPSIYAEAETNAIYLWSRQWSSVPLATHWSWVGGWLIHMTTGVYRVWVLYPITATILMAIAYGVIVWKLRKNSRATIQPVQPAHTMPHYLVLAVPIFVGLLIWWFTAPDPRFVRSLFWLLPMLMAYLLLQALAKIQWGTPRLNYVALFLFVNLAVLVTFATYARNIVTIPADFTPTPIPEVVSKKLPGQLVIWTPVEGDRCWDVELPCTPYLNLQLQLRGNDFQHGFTVLSEMRESIASQIEFKKP